MRVFIQFLYKHYVNHLLIVLSKKCYVVPRLQFVYRVAIEESWSLADWDMNLLQARICLQVLLRKSFFNADVLSLSMCNSALIAQPWFVTLTFIYFSKQYDINPLVEIN